MISLENVTKAYHLKNGHVKVIVENLTTTIPHTNIGILGRNGMGKSTLLRMIAGIEDPDEGQIIRHGSVSWPLGFSGSFHGELTGVENIRFVARVYGQDTEHVIAYVKEFAELGEFFYAPLRTYSSGMRARLAFGISLAIEFDYYLVDELMAVGDERFKQKSREAFKSKLSNARLLLVSHSMHQIREFCDMGIVVHDGTMTHYANIEDAISIYQDINAK